MTEHRVTVPDRRPKKWIISPSIGDYSTRNQGFLTHIDDVKQKISNYLERPRTKRPLNFLISAPPGNGKSFLIKQIARSIPQDIYQTIFEEVYVGSFDRIDELYAIFLRIQSFNLQGKVPFVFFDEVDSKIGDTYIYQKLLAPMWDGDYFVGKERYTLGKCIFFFAGSTLGADEKSTEIIDSAKKKGAIIDYEDYYNDWLSGFMDVIAKKNSAEGSKILDFVDRIDRVIRIPPIDSVFLGDELKVEYYDMIFTIIRKHFPGVTLVGKKVVERIFLSLSTGKSIRDIEKIVFNSRLSGTDTFDASSLTHKTMQELGLSETSGDGYYQVVVNLPKPFATRRGPIT